MDVTTFIDHVLFSTPQEKVGSNHGTTQNPFTSHHTCSISTYLVSSYYFTMTIFVLLNKLLRHWRRKNCPTLFCAILVAPSFCDSNESNCYYNVLDFHSWLLTSLFCPRRKLTPLTVLRVTEESVSRVSSFLLWVLIYFRVQYNYLVIVKTLVFFAERFGTNVNKHPINS